MPCVATMPGDSLRAGRMLKLQEQPPGQFKAMCRKFKRRLDNALAHYAFGGAESLAVFRVGLDA
jgi:hypothetical protein